MKMLKIKRLNAQGIGEFRTFLENGGTGKPPAHLLASDEYSEDCGLSAKLDHEKTFTDRLEMAKYVWEAVKSEWKQELERDVGLWSWLCLLYFDQFRPKKKLNREEHYIYNPHRNLHYRHCVAGPIIAYRNFGDAGKVFVSKKMEQMGDMIEQCFSRQYLMRSDALKKLMISLYRDETTNAAKPGAASKTTKKKKNGKWSKAGAGSVRRLALEVKRLHLTFNIEELSANDLMGMLGDEYNKFKPQENQAS